MRLARSVAVLVVSTLVLAGCFTGKRPTLAAPTAPVTDAAVAAVLTRLQMPLTSPFTATYSILTKLTAGGAPAPTTAATVAQTDSNTRSVTIGTIRFLQQSAPQTCDLTGARPCEPGLLDERTSNLIVGHDFWSVSPASKLAQDATTTIAAGIPSTRQVAGQTATCAQLRFAAGSKTYCAVDGLLAAQDTPDLRIDLLSEVPSADPGLFTNIASATTLPAATGAASSTTVVGG